MFGLHTLAPEISSSEETETPAEPQTTLMTFTEPYNGLKHPIICGFKFMGNSCILGNYPYKLSIIVRYSNSMTRC